MEYFTLSLIYFQEGKMIRFDIQWAKVYEDILPVLRLSFNVVPPPRQGVINLPDAIARGVPFV